MNWLRHEIGKRLIWLGYGVLPPDTKKAMSMLAGLGVEWIKQSEETFYAGLRGEKITFLVSSEKDSEAQ